MNRRELLIRDDLRIVLQSPFTKEAFYELYRRVSEAYKGQRITLDFTDFSDDERPVDFTVFTDLSGYDSRNPLKKYFEEYSLQFQSFSIKHVHIDKIQQHTYPEGGIFIFVGDAQVVISERDNPQRLSFQVKMGDLLSVIGDNVQVSVKSDRGQMYVVQFTEWIGYEDEDDDSQETVRNGETLPSGRRVGPWTFRFPEGISERGTYNRLGQRTGVWTFIDSGEELSETWQDGRRLD